MKELSLSIIAVILLALGIGLAFHWLYPRVELGAELLGLFVFVAIAIKLVFSKLWSLTQKKPAAKDGK